jgi:hypothetical protein
MDIPFSEENEKERKEASKKERKNETISIIQTGFLDRERQGASIYSWDIIFAAKIARHQQVDSHVRFFLV